MNFEEERKIRRIQEIIRMYIDYRKHYRGANFYMSFKNITKHKNYKYFERLYELEELGEIIFPEFFEVIFTSPKWGGNDIRPNQLNCEKIIAIWEPHKKYIRHISEDDKKMKIIQNINRIISDMNSSWFKDIMKGEENDKNINSFWEYKKLVDPEMYDLFMKTDDKLFAGICKEELDIYKEKSDNILQELEKCGWNDNLIYTLESNKHNYLKWILSYMLLLKKAEKTKDAIKV